MVHFSVYISMRVNKDYHCFPFQVNQIKDASDTDYPDSEARAIHNLG